jgi:hypothetical protein
MSRMPTMSNYTMFHEWLNKFIPGIYSDNFTLTPGMKKYFNTYIIVIPIKIKDMIGSVKLERRNVLL